MYPCDAVTPTGADKQGKLRLSYVILNIITVKEETVES